MKKRILFLDWETLESGDTVYSSLHVLGSTK